MTITAYPVRVAVDATSLIKLVGPPNKAVYWSLTGSTGTVTPINVFTDDQGRAAALFRPADGQFSEGIALTGPNRHYPMNETSGTIMTDVANSLDGSYVGNPVLGASPIVYGEGSSVSFEDTSQHALADNTGQMLTLYENDYTVQAWVTIYSIPPGSGAAYDAAYGIAVKPGWPVGLSVNNAGKLVGNTYRGNAAYSVTSTTSLEVGKPYHVAFTVSKTNGEIELYLNGQNVDSNTFTPGAAARSNGAVWAIGVGNYNNPTGSYGWPLDGRIQRVAFHTRVLTPTEMSDLYAARPSSQVGNTATIHATYGA